MTNNIEKLVGLQRLKKLNLIKNLDTAKITAMVRQFEALYCYQICKSIIMSEIEEDNPEYSCLVTGYQVERSSSHRPPYYGLKAYEQNGGPINKLVAQD